MTCPSACGLPRQTVKPSFCIGQAIVFDLKNRSGDDPSSWTLAVAFSTSETGPQIELTNATVIALGDNNNTIRVTIPQADSLTLTAGALYGEVWRTDAGNERPIALVALEILDCIFDPEYVAPTYGMLAWTQGSTTFSLTGDAPLTLANVYGAWRFNDSLEDSSGNGNHMEVYEFGAQTPITYANGHMGRCVWTGGAIQAIQAGNGLGDEFSISFWVNFQTNLNTEGTAFWIKNGQSQLYVTADGSNITVHLPNSSQDSGTYPSDQWNHIVYTYSQPGGFGAITEKVYVNGVLAMTGGYFYFGFGNTIRVGSGIGSQVTSPIQDYLDTLLAWNYVLSQDDIDTLYNGGAGYDPTA